MADPLVTPMMVQVGGQVLGGLFGRKKKGTGVPQQQVAKTGYEALPAWMQDYIKQQQQLTQQAIHGTKEAPVSQLQAAYQQYQGNPESPFYNPEMAALQEAQGELPVQQIGVQAQLNPYQQAAMQKIGGMDYSPESMAQFLQPYNDIYKSGLNKINEGYDALQGRIVGQDAKYHSRTRSGSSLNLQRLQEATESDRLKAQEDLAARLQKDSYEQGYGRYNQALDRQMGVGDFLNQYQQQQLENASGYNRTAKNPVYGQTQAMQQLWNPYLGAHSSTQTGAIPAQLNNIGRIGGALMALGNQNFGGQQNKQWNW